MLISSVAERRFIGEISIAIVAGLTSPRPPRESALAVDLMRWADIMFYLAKAVLVVPAPVDHPDPGACLEEWERTALGDIADRFDEIADRLGPTVDSSILEATGRWSARFRDPPLLGDAYSVSQWSPMPLSGQRSSPERRA